MRNKVRYYLERPEQGKECAITGHYSFRRGSEKFIRFSTGEYALFEHWDKETQRLKEHLSVEYSHTNQFLDDLAAEAQRIVRTHRQERRLLHLTGDKLKAMLRSWIDGSAPDFSKTTLKEYFLQFIEDSKKTKSKSSIKQYRATYHHFLAFCEWIKYDVDFEDITLATMKKFRDYFWELEPPQSDNNVWKNLSNFFFMLDDAVQNEITQNDKFRHIKICRQLNVCKFTADAIALYLPDLKKLYKTELPERLQYVRDMFIAASFTGLRVSDWGEIRHENIKEKNGMKFLTAWTRKTSKYVTIPVHPYVLEILARYNGSFENRPTDQAINRQLKEICQLAGLTDTVSLKSRRRGQWVPDKLPKFELVTSHTARRSFATNAFLSGDIQKELIMRVVGHKNEETFDKYVKKPDNEAAIQVGQSDFFKI